MTSTTAAALAVALLAGCSSNDNGNASPSASGSSAAPGAASPSGSASEPGKEAPTVTFMTAWDPGFPISSDLPVFVEWGKRTGVKFEVNSPPRDSYVEKMNVTLASNELPDMMKFFQDDSSFNNYGPRLFVPLDDYIKDGKLPNLERWFKKYPDVEKRMRNPVDGKIYGFPLIQDFEAATSMWYVRNDLLKKGGMDASQIKSLDDLKKAMLILKEQTGGPITSSRLGYTYYNWTTQVYFGVADGVGGDGTNKPRYDPYQKKFVFSPIEDEQRFKKWVEFERWMYQEKLLDPAFLTMKDTELKAGYESGKYPLEREQLGSGKDLNPKNDPSIEVAPILPFQIDGYMPTQMKNYHFNIGFRSPVVINKNSKHIDDIIRAMDYTYSDEGIEFFVLGVEGETFERDSKTPSGYRLDKVQSVWTRDANGNYPEGMKMLQDSGYNTLWLTGVWPAYHRYNLLNFKEGENEKATADMNLVKQLEDIGNLHEEPIILWSKEENQKRTELSAPLNTYLSENVIKFVMGSKPMSEWDSFIAGLKKFKPEELTKMYNDKMAASQ